MFKGIFDDELILTCCSNRPKRLSSVGCNTKLTIRSARGPVVRRIGPSWREWRRCSSTGSSNWWLKTMNTESFKRRLGSRSVLQYFRKLRGYCLEVPVQLDGTNSMFVEHLQEWLCLSNTALWGQTYLNDSRVLQAGRSFWGLTHGEVLDVAASEDDVLKDFISRWNRPLSGSVLSSKRANCTKDSNRIHSN